MCVSIISTHLTINRSWYIIIRSASSVRKEVYIMQYIMSFVMAVMARVVGDYVSKWLDGHKKSDK